MRSYGDLLEYRIAYTELRATVTLVYGDAVEKTKRMSGKIELCRNEELKTISRKSDSYCGSLQHQSSSSPSSLSITCSSMDYQPSTSGYSSDMAYCALQKIKKKEKVKQYLKELRSMIPNELGNKRKFGTLSTLQHVLNSMRKIKEEPSKRVTDDEMSQVNVTDTIIREPLTTERKIKLWIAVSMNDHKIQEVSPILMQLLLYPKLYCITESSADQRSEAKATPKRSFCVRISLNSSFSLESPSIYQSFEMKAIYRPQDKATKTDGLQDRRLFHWECLPLHSPYQEDGCLPDKVTFTTRHSRHCQFSHVHSNAIHLLGYLPQDINEKPIFDFYHPSDLVKLYEVHQEVLKCKGDPFDSPPMRMKAHNGDYVEVQTKWSTFLNPWSKQLEFVIGHHTVIKGPENIDVFAEPKVLKMPLNPNTHESQQKMHALIRNLLVQPKEMGAPSTCSPPPRKKPTPEPVTDLKEELQQIKIDSANLRDAKESMKPHVIYEKEVKVEKATRDISAMYNQLNYSHNIKRYLMSQTVSASTGHEFGMDLFYGDPITSAGITKDIVNLSVPKPPSFGSSTMVRVSEHHEDNLPGQQLEQELFLPRWTPQDDAPHVMLTEAALRKHTKLQERLLCEQAEKDKNMFGMNKSRAISSHQNNLKRMHCGANSEADDEPIAKQTNWAIPTAVNATSSKVHKTMPGVTSNGFTQFPYVNFDMAAGTCFLKPLMKRGPHNIIPIPNGANPNWNMQWPCYSQTASAMPGVYQSVPSLYQPFSSQLCMGLNLMKAPGPQSQFSDIRRSSSEECSYAIFRNHQ
ncbi:uncharacterized protein LOC121389849 [Gigantopelta aegis]|uniref:uncharacterized protein LOC121389849 n=1 Tax=Gigantopelta aegis TaxID=1735272 RepID=UPI001B888A14|nr:uncharacterized protein LOC121389849 [Gigantopelta aegis]